MNNASMLPPPVRHESPTTVSDPGGRLLDFFGGCNYLGLAQHPAALEAAAETLRTHGLSSGASRTTTGNTDLHAELEEQLRAFLGFEAVCLLPDGYTANIAAAQALASLGARAARLDERAHPSIQDAAHTAGLLVERFPHRRPNERASAIRGVETLWTDGVFTADGALAPLPEALEALDSRGWLIVDDCHGFAAIGSGGRGTAARHASDPRVVMTTTLAKGLGAAGGVVAGPREVIERVRACTAFVCTTPVAPALAAAAIASLSVLRQEPERVQRLAHNAAQFRAALQVAGLAVAVQPTPIIGAAPFEPDRMQAIHAVLRDDGFVAPLIGYPGGARPLYFRLVVTSEHTDEQIERFAASVARAITATAPAGSRAAGAHAPAT